ncbi:hypothetical protein [Vibrio cholerae]|uniref:hypothetical protein n=1 Tax=Vibrio cholerae TaxID=666 RepID=UPI001E59BDA8|nr:hypothetical protein [Vibrio cholerae]MCD1213207.1 hypothetical protein [Vibrio cholerae]
MEIVNILLGAGIASIVPVLTLVLSNSRWKKEQRIDHLRRKYEKLEKAYIAVNEALPEAVVDNSYPSHITSLITTHGSDEVKKVLRDFVMIKDKTDEQKKSFIFSMSSATNKHLLEIDKKIEDILT